MAIATGVIGAATAAYFLVPGVREWVDTAIDVLARGDVALVRDYLLGFGVWAPVVSALAHDLAVHRSPAAGLRGDVRNGLLFGWVWGALLSWSSAMAGAALCFWIARASRTSGRREARGRKAALEVSDLFFERYGDRAVLIARLLPFVSFDIISYGSGLTSMDFWRFFWATGLGQLPATLVYSYLGQNLTGSVRVLFLIFLFTTVVFVAGSAIRPFFMARMRARAEAAGSHRREHIVTESADTSVAARRAAARCPVEPARHRGARGRQRGRARARILPRELRAGRGVLEHLQPAWTAAAFAAVYVAIALSAFKWPLLLRARGYRLGMRDSPGTISLACSSTTSCLPPSAGTWSALGMPARTSATLPGAPRQ